MESFGKEELELKCDRCGRPKKVTLDQVAKEQVIHCTCGRRIQLKDKGRKTRKAVRDMDKSFKDLENTMKKIGKRRF